MFLSEVTPKPPTKAPSAYQEVANTPKPTASANYGGTDAYNGKNIIKISFFHYNYYNDTRNFNGFPFFYSTYKSNLKIISASKLKSTIEPSIILIKIKLS
jgi:hypothetical protein